MHSRKIPQFVMNYLPWLRALCLCSICLLMASCESRPSSTLSVFENADSTIIQGSHFSHRVVLRQHFNEIITLNVYIHGDGQPWLGERGDKIAANPSPDHSMAWALFNSDPNPSLFVGRPCYFVELDAGCHPGYWTNARYSQEVVVSLASIIKNIAQEYSAQNLVLIGYSGGGSLAVLVAAELPQTRKVITVAANLDHDAWTRFHHYSALDGSLNAARVQLDPSIEQIHLSGSKDKNVPASLNQIFYKLNGVKAQIIKGYTHECCWQDYWLQHTELLAPR